MQQCLRFEQGQKMARSTYRLRAKSQDTGFSLTRFHFRDKLLFLNGIDCQTRKFLFLQFFTFFSPFQIVQSNKNLKTIYW